MAADDRSPAAAPSFLAAPGAGDPSPAAMPAPGAVTLPLPFPANSMVREPRSSSLCLPCRDAVVGCVRPVVFRAAGPATGVGVCRSRLPSKAARVPIAVEAISTGVRYTSPATSPPRSPIPSSLSTGVGPDPLGFQRWRLLLLAWERSPVPLLTPNPFRKTIRLQSIMCRRRIWTSDGNP